MQQTSTPGSGGPGSELRSDAQQIASSATSRLHSEVDARKGVAVSQAKSVSSALQRVSGELDQEAPQWLKSAFRQGAEQVQRFADTFDQKDSRQLVNEAQTFARERPGTFLAACAAAGFAAARVIKAGGEARGPQQPEAVGNSDPMPGEITSESSFGASSRGEFV